MEFGENNDKHMLIDTHYMQHIVYTICNNNTKYYKINSTLVRPIKQHHQTQGFVYEYKQNFEHSLEKCHNMRKMLTKTNLDVFEVRPYSEHP